MNNLLEFLIEHLVHIYEAIDGLIEQVKPHGNAVMHHLHKIETWTATVTLVLGTVFRCSVSPLGLLIAVIVLLTAYLQHH